MPLDYTLHKAVIDAPQSRNQQELRSFLGLLQYYQKFLPNLATLLHPLNRLLQVKTSWCWTLSCEQAFQAAKQLLVKAPVFDHYDTSLPLRME